MQRAPQASRIWGLCLHAPQKWCVSSAMNPPISCYIRAKNEERLIAEVIKAALAVADEVIVIDSGQRDTHASCPTDFH